MPSFLGGLTFKAHRRVYHSALGSRVIKKQTKPACPNAAFILAALIKNVAVRRYVLTLDEISFGANWLHNPILSRVLLAHVGDNGLFGFAAQSQTALLSGIKVESGTSQSKSGPSVIYVTVENYRQLETKTGDRSWARTC